MSRNARWLGLLSFALTSCSSPPPPSPEPDAAQPPGPAWFADVTEAVRLDFRQHAGATGRYFMPQVMGSGLALLDFDNDGRLDLLLLNNAGPDSKTPHRLYRHLPDGTFRDVTAGSGVDVAGYGMGVAVGDVDNDGWVDVYVSQYGGGRLFRNRGNGTFEDATDSAGVALPRWGTSTSFVDYDRDGWLDLVVVNYVDYDPSRACVETTGRQDYCHPNQFPGTAARLFRNRGRSPEGRWLGYLDVSVPSGLAAKPSNGLGVACADFNGDGWVDLFVANDARPNHLWINRRDGTFVDEAIEHGVAYNGSGNVQANMGVALADVDRDGHLDLFVTHLSEELHTLWRQNPRGRFHDATAAAGLASPRWRGTGFGTVAADFDHDGYPDLAVVNGRVIRARVPSGGTTRDDLPEFWHTYAERNQLFANDGTGKFRDVSADNPQLAARGVYRGLAWGDLDGDGAIDLVATAVEGPARVFRNVAPKKGHWLMVRAFDPALKRDAYGAVVTVAVAGRRYVALANPGLSYCSSGDPRAHFGLGPAEAVDEVRVDWPDGSREVFPGGPVDRSLTLHRGRGRPLVTP